LIVDFACEMFYVTLQYESWCSVTLHVPVTTDV